MKVLVTGAFGFIGSHMVLTLKKLGCQVRAVDIKRLSSCYLPLVADEIHECFDLRNLSNTLVATKNVDYVFNFAANMGGIGFISKVGAEVMRDNALININVLEASRINKVKRVFFSSSACIYPTYRQENPDVTPLKEEFAIPANPDNFYGWEKLFTEKLMEAYARDYGVGIRVARLHNVYGPYGTFRGGREKAPAALCRKVALAQDGSQIVLWGDGRQTRSFLYVDDCVNGLWLLMNSSYDKPLNIGSSRLVTIDELLRMIVKISGKKWLTVKHDLSKPQGVRGRNADLTLVKQMIDWEPKVSLEEGLEKTYCWIEKEVNKHGTV